MLKRVLKKIVELALPFAIFASEAYCGWTMWNWFVSPLSLANFMGLMFLLSLLVFFMFKYMGGNVIQIKQALVDKFRSSEEKDAFDFAVNSVYVFVPWVYLLFGYIAYRLM